MNFVFRSGSRAVIALVFCVIVFFKAALAQFPPAAGLPGSTAIHADSNCFVGWAVACTVVRGYVNIADTTVVAGNSNRASYGSPSDATGKADNVVVSLGDKGIATLTFEFPIVNGPGWDFAVFENALNDTFLELAFVEVSSNGTDFFRFPSVSLTQTNTQTGPFGSTEAVKIHNLAGKYRVMYGVPFNLDDLSESMLLDKNNITHVRIIDVSGSINPQFGSTDHLGNMINDPFPTPFASCGFDLDAVGVIHNTQTRITTQPTPSFRIFPNPADEYLCLQHLQMPVKDIICFNVYGSTYPIQKISENCYSIHGLATGIYFMQLTFVNESSAVLKFMKQ